MVNTRSSRANEPLESLQTPTKKQSKLRGRSTMPPSEELTKNVALTPSSKRTHDQVDDLTESPAKRTRCEGGDYIFQYARGEEITNSDDDATRSAPPKSLAETIRRERCERAERKAREQLYGKPVERTSLPRPGSVRAGTRPYRRKYEQDVQAAGQRSEESINLSKAASQRDREARSTAPESETPQRGLFGSLRNLGSATIGRALSTIGSFTPLGSKQKSATPENKDESTPQQAQTEPHKRPSRKAAWEIEYPAIPPSEDIAQTPTRRMFGEVPESAKVDKDSDSEAEKRRKAFIRKWGEPDPRYDHLHLVPLEGRPEDLPYPPKKKAAQPEYTSTASEEEKAFFRARKARREAILGKPPVEELPTKAPLFGPNSHYARRTRAPEVSDTSAPFSSLLAADIGGAGSKRKFADEETATDRPQSMQATVEDAPDSPDGIEGPSTPASKRQKTSDALQTPRSAMKAPGSIGRSGRNVAFNYNPVSSVRNFSPIHGDRRAGDRPFVPGSPFNTFTEELEYAEKQKQKAAGGREGESPASVASTESYGVSPTTFANTQANRHIQSGMSLSIHPGDAFTQMVNSTLPTVQYAWSDPYDPSWRPSLANPEPGTFRFVFEGEEDYEMENLADIEEEATGRRPEKRASSAEPEPESAPAPAPAPATPPQPSTPRMSHAELPKQPPVSTPISASALEAANLERRLAEAARTKPRTGSRLAEVTTARSRSPSPPHLDPATASDDNESVRTPSPTLESGTPATAGQPTWTWTDETNEYICSNPSFPDFAYNSHSELIPSFCLQTSTGTYDNTLTGPDGMTEAARQKHYMANWAEKETFDFGEPQTYEESGCGTKFIHDLLRMNEKKNPQMFQESQQRFAREWDAHQAAIEDAEKEGRELVASYPDREWMEESIDEGL